LRRHIDAAELSVMRAIALMGDFVADFSGTERHLLRLLIGKCSLPPSDVRATSM